MKKDFNHHSFEQQRTAVIGAMKGIERQVSKLAAAPGAAGKKGFSGIKSDSRVPEGSGTDGMLGSLLFETLFGGPLMSAFTQAAGLPDALNHIDISNTIDLVDEYRTDRAGAHPFSSLRDIEEEMFVNDLPARDMLESEYAALSQVLDELDYSAEGREHRDHKPEMAQQKSLRADPLARRFSELNM